MMSLCKNDAIITSTMKRTQISLTAEQLDALRSLSRRTGRSMSDLIRESIDELIEREAGSTRSALALLGAFEADRDDVSLRHDDYFAGTVKP